MSTENINNVENSNQKPINEAELYSEAVQILEINSNKLELNKKAKELLEQIPNYKNAQKLIAECDSKIESIRRQMAEKKAKKASRIRAIIIAAIVVVVGILAVSAVASSNSQTQKDYEAALLLLENAHKNEEKGKNADPAYISAYEKLVTLGTYKDAGLKAIEDYFARVCDAADNAKYARANELFAKALKHSSAQFATDEMIKKTEDYIYNAILKDANTRYDSGDYNNALDLYKMLDQEDKAIIEKMDGCKFEGVKSSKVGSTVRFGSYEIDGSTCDFEDSIEWVVLAKDGNKYLLMTNEIIDIRAYNKDATTVTWEKSTIRNWLNGEFLKGAFSELELSKMMTVKNGEVDDRVFLLSVEEAGKYLNDNNSVAGLSGYAAYKSSHLDDTGMCKGWWLRDTFGAYDASVVDEAGKVVSDGYQVNDGFVGVRPAIWVVID